MTEQSPPVHLAHDIARNLGALAAYLPSAPPHEVAQILGTVLDPDQGVLGQLTTLVEHGSRATKTQAERGTFPPEMWLALGRAANDLGGLCVELDDHAPDFRRLGNPPQTATPTVAQPTASALVVTRRRR
ncbi:hypothetical protein [Streptomyces chattanoogensis]|uniref:Uncharacterized protein n=1 Tax=Streptomyces chattanoogensis TaxID=66876 RepID=A0A0N0XWT4_9ACTN|nr:hypothetical protein [Streptomyces chattanoogensis]KPC62666.1 hypothetical protein ADL29_18135 [Streptomyces chattanoogensis]